LKTGKRTSKSTYYSILHDNSNISLPTIIPSTNILENNKSEFKEFEEELEE